MRFQGRSKSFSKFLKKNYSIFQKIPFKKKKKSLDFKEKNYILNVFFLLSERSKSFLNF